MSQPEAVPVARDVRARLTFIVPQADKPRFESAALTGGEPRVYFQTEQREVLIHNARPIAGTLSLDTTGFELHRHATAVEDLDDDAAVHTAYRAELEALLRERTGADRVGVFDFTRRSDAPRGASERRVKSNTPTRSAPVRSRSSASSSARYAVCTAASSSRSSTAVAWRCSSKPVVSSDSVPAIGRAL